MTTNGIISVARRLLQDSTSPYRWPDAELKQDLQFAIRELHKARPETRYIGMTLTDGIVLPADASAQIGIDDRYEECLAYYVVYLAYMNDASDTINLQLAENYLQKFAAKVQF